MSMFQQGLPDRPAYHRPVRLGGQKGHHGGAWERRIQPSARTTAKLRMLQYFAKQLREEMRSCGY